MRSLPRLGFALGVASLATACATLPTGPSVMVLPGHGKSFDEFRYDDGMCRDFALDRTGVTTERAATDAAVTSAAIGTGLGAAAGAAIGAAAGNPGMGAAVGAGSGLLVGSAAGVDQAAWANASVQQRFDVAYQSCMYAQGHQIPVAAGSVQPYTQKRPPPRPQPLRPSYVPRPPPGPPPPPPPDAG